MTAANKIFIASKRVALDKWHLYLVKDIDGNEFTVSDQSVIRGGPQHEEDGPTAPWGNIKLEVNVGLAQSFDRFDANKPKRNMSLFQCAKLRRLHATPQNITGFRKMQYD